MKLTSVLEIDYDRHGVDELVLVDMLRAVVNEAMGNGGFTGDGAAEIHTWSHTVGRSEGTRWWFVPTGDFDDEPLALDATDRESALEEALNLGRAGYVTDDEPETLDDPEDQVQCP